MSNISFRCYDGMGLHRDNGTIGLDLPANADLVQVIVEDLHTGAAASVCLDRETFESFLRAGTVALQRM